MKLSTTSTHSRNRIPRTLMGFSLLLESALELGDGLLEAGSFLHQLIDTLGGFFQPHCSFLVHILHAPGHQKQTT
jgi:hypothetical protein